MKSRLSQWQDQRKKIKLTDDDIKRLKSIFKKKDINQILSARCRILINLDEDLLHAMTYDQYQSVCNVSQATIAKTVKLFASSRIDKVLTINRNTHSENTRRKIDGKTKAKIIEVVCAPVFESHVRWTIRLLKDRLRIELDEHISCETIRPSPKNFDLTVAKLRLLMSYVQRFQIGIMNVSKSKLTVCNKGYPY